MTSFRYFSTFTGIGGFERGIAQAWESVSTAESETSSTKAINQNAKTASKSISSTGGLRTKNHTKSTRELSGANSDKRCSICMDTNVSAVKKPNQCSLHSNTETVTEYYQKLVDDELATVDQCYWHYMKTRELKDKEKLREYPSREREAFLYGGSPYFDPDALIYYGNNIKEPTLEVEYATAL